MHRITNPHPSLLHLSSQHTLHYLNCKIIEKS